MAFRISRPGASLLLCAVALTLAGCNAQHQGELAANVAAGANVEAGNGQFAAAQNPAAQAQLEIIEPKIDGVPLPPARPDFAKLAKERELQAVGATQVAAGATPTVVQSTPEGGVTTVAQAYAPPPQPAAPSGIFSIFAGAPADPAAPVQVAAAPPAASDAPAHRASLLAYERRVSGEDIPTATTPAASTAYRLAPAAVVEVAGVTRELQPARATFASPALIGPGPQIAGSFGMGGRNWRPAYDHVVTNCFGPDLRAALENIARHFNSEVLVTSGHRANGRSRSMHRFCRAADIRVVGVSPGTVARYAASVPGVNGVGTYRRVAVTHVDTRENQMAWRY